MHSTSHTYLGYGAKIIVTDRSGAPLRMEVFKGRELIMRHDLTEHAAIHLASSLMRAARRRTDDAELREKISIVSNSLVAEKKRTAERIAHVERDLAQTRDVVQSLLDRGIEYTPEQIQRMSPAQYKRAKRGARIFP